MVNNKDVRCVINITDLSVEELEKLMDLADDIIADPVKYSEICHGKKLATLFFEPSTRTRLSFESAMMELGGN
ncbi:MAG: aspartate carbamoyltransferase, partial [Bacillota bacterium]|nr:aspartate carbamoyltransferase [Bacillota bacterium]